MQEGTVSLRGNLGTDPVARYTAGGDLVVDFRLAVVEHSRRGGIASEETAWYRCVVAGEIAGLAKDLSKGDRIGVVGTLHERPWIRYGRRGTVVVLHVSEITTDRPMVDRQSPAVQGGGPKPSSPLEAARAAGLFGDPTGQD